MSRTGKLFGFGGLIIAMFMGTLDSTIVNIALPKLMTEFNTNLSGASWVATIYALALAVFMISATKLADKFGRKKIMLLGLACFTLFSAACMYANSLSMLLVFRFFQGIGGAIITPLVLPIGTHLLGKQNISKIAAVVGAFTALAAASGPAAGGIILEYTSWHWIFGLNVPIGIIAFLLVLIFTSESYDDTLTGNFDILGMLMLTLMLGGVTFGLLEGREYGWTSTLILSSFGAGIIGIILFIFVEFKASSPIVEFNLFREKTFTASSIVYLITGFALVVPSVIFNYYLQNVLNYTALHSALTIIPVSLAIVVGMPLGTKLADKIGANPVNFIGILLISASFLTLSLITTDTSRAVMIVFLIISGAGFGFSTVSYVSSVKHLPQAKTGTGSGIANSARQIGMCLGIAVLVTILNANVATAKNNIRDTAIAAVNSKNMSDTVRNVATTEIKSLFSNNDSKNTDYATKQAQLTNKLKAATSDKSNLPIPEPGTADYRTLYDAAQKLSTGNRQLTESLRKTSHLTVSNTQLTAIIDALLSGSTTLENGQNKVSTAIQLLAQKNELQNVLHQIKQQKNTQLSQAFSKTYLICAIMLVLCSPIALFSDRRVTD